MTTVPVSGATASNECITVVVRCRPLNRKELDEKRKSIIDIDIEARQVGIHNPDSSDEPPKSFTFDAAYDEKTQQRIFYEESCFPIVDSTLEGFNSTIFAYGQTGCGKSFTMQGPSTTDEELKGVIPNSFSHIFQFVQSTKDIEFLIRCSYLELYNEEIRDLLAVHKHPNNNPNQTKCELKEDPNKGIYVKGLTDVVVDSPDDLSKMLDKGLSNRTTAATLMNSESSRSHSIFTIVVEMNTKDATTGKDMLRVGKLNLVDLAGSERAKKTGAKDATLKEGIKINLSLSVLGNVISALAEGGKFIPYRDSKLTRLLQDSLGGNTKTMMVAAISPADYNYEETLSTLRYANRAKNIKNKPKINEDPKDALIREFKMEIERLRLMLAEQQQASTHHLHHSPSIHAALSGHNNAPSSGHHHQTVIDGTNTGHGGQEIAIQASHGPQGGYTNPAPPPLRSSSEHIMCQSQEPSIYAAHSPSASPIKQQRVLRESSGVSQRKGIVSDVAREELVQETGCDEELQQFISMDNYKSSPSDIYGNEVYEAEEDEQQEAAMMEQIESRIHQLEHMLVNHEEHPSVTQLATGISINTSMKYNSNNNSNDNSISKGDQIDSPRVTRLLNEGNNDINDTVANQIQLQAEIEAEEARKKYKERKLKAKKRREDKQQQEMQRILDEKKLMEDELEELRQAAIVASQQTPSQTPVTSNEADVTMLKKINKMKKRYEKKIAAMKEELEEVREEFTYQRKQLVDAAIEQEKDGRLFELICRSILSEKDLKKIIEKSRYDEEHDEWIVPFLKRRSLDHIEILPQHPSSLSNDSSCINNTYDLVQPHAPRNGLLPDINQHTGNTNNYVNGNLNTNNVGSKTSSGQGTRPSSKTASQPTNTNSNVSHMIIAEGNSNSKQQRIKGSNTGTTKASNRPSIVPLLTLPGTLITSAAAIMNDGLDNEARSSSGNSYQAISYDGNTTFSSHSQRSDRSTSMGYHNFVAQEDPSIQSIRRQPQHQSKQIKKKLKKESSAYSSSTNGSPTTNAMKMPSIFPSQPSSHSENYYEGETTMSHLLPSDHAGPIEDWNFAPTNKASRGDVLPSANSITILPPTTKNNHQQQHHALAAQYLLPMNSSELEYSDDEDFAHEVVKQKSRAINNDDYSNGEAMIKSAEDEPSQQRNKKKKKKKNRDKLDDTYSPSTTSLVNNNGNYGCNSLPPIDGQKHNGSPRSHLAITGMLPPI